MAKQVSFNNNQYFVAARLYGMCIRYAKKSGFSFSDGPVDYKDVTDIESFCVGQAIFDTLTEYEGFISQRKLQGYYLLARFYRLVTSTYYGKMYFDFVICKAKLDNPAGFELTENDIISIKNKVLQYADEYSKRSDFLQDVMLSEYKEVMAAASKIRL